MQRIIAIASVVYAALFSSCASRSDQMYDHPEQYSAEIGRARIVDGPRDQVSFSVPGPGRYDIALWYFITDSGAGYDALARVTGTVAVAYRGHVIQQERLPRLGKRSDLFTDTNGLILIRLAAPKSGQYILRLNITLVPPHLEVGGAGIIVLKLVDPQRPNQTMQRTAGSVDSSLFTKFHPQPAPALALASRR